MHEHSTFITLTYANEHLPYGGDLRHEDFQKFIKRLRKWLSPKKLRFYMCGEYGTENFRPHYHAIIFGVKFPDQKYAGERHGNKYFTSEILLKLWGKGRIEISGVNEKTAEYTARYTLQKQQEEDLERIVESTGEIIHVQKPYNRASNRPGIGHAWFQKYSSDIFPHDHAVGIDGRVIPTPGYYRVLLQRQDPELSEDLRQRRIEKAQSNSDNTPERLEAREKCRKAKTQSLKREL